MTEHWARAYWTVAAERGQIWSERLPELGPGQALVETLHSGISRGTELLVHRGRVPVSEYARMRAPHQQGEFPWPVKYGYASVGRVRQGPEALLGRDVFSLYPHQTSCDRRRRAGSLAAAGACRARRARRQHGDRAQRALGRRAQGR